MSIQVKKGDFICITAASPNHPTCLSSCVSMSCHVVHLGVPFSGSTCDLGGK